MNLSKKCKECPTLIHINIQTTSIHNYEYCCETCKEKAWDKFQAGPIPKRESIQFQSETIQRGVKT